MPSPAKPPNLPTFVAAPQIGSREELDEALFALAYLKQRQVEIDALCAQAVELQKKIFQQKMVEDVEGTTMTLSDLRSAYGAVVASYCKEQRTQLLEGNLKSLKLPHGTVGWRDVPAEVTFKEGETASDVLGRLAEKHGLLAKILALLKRLRLERVVTLRPSLNISAMRDDIRNGVKKKGDLPNGVKVVGPGECFYARPAEYVPQAEAPR